MDRRGAWMWLGALAATFVALIVFSAFMYGGGPGIAAFAAVEMLAMLALAVGVAWATARKR